MSLRLLILITALCCLLLSCATSEDEQDAVGRLKDFESRHEEQQVQREEQAQQSTINRAKKLLNRTGSYIVLLMEWKQEREEWDALTTSLLSNDTGRYIASDSSFVVLFEKLREDNGYTVPEITNRHMVHEADKSQLENIISSSEPQLSDERYYEITQALDKTLSLMDDRWDGLRESQQKLEDMIKISLRDNEQSESTLEDAIMARRERFFKVQAEELRQLVDEHDSAKIKERKAFVDDSLTKVRVAQAEQDSARLAWELAEAQRIADSTERAERLKRRQAEADDPNVRALFAPFLEHGYRIPSMDSRGNCYWNKTTNRAQPLGLDNLIVIGALDNVERFVAVGASRFTRPGAGPKVKNDRPHWSWPQNEAEWDEYEKRLGKFKTLMRIWVDDGVLAP